MHSGSLDNRSPAFKEINSLYLPVTVYAEASLYFLAKLVGEPGVEKPMYWGEHASRVHGEQVPMLENQIPKLSIQTP